MTRTDILIRFIKKSIAPIITAILLYNLFVGLCIANGSVNYMYLLMLCGIPFGIRFMFTLPVWKLLVAVCYVPYTAGKLITA